MSCFGGRMNILARSKTLGGPHTVLRLQDRRGSQIPTRRAGWLAGARGGGERGSSAGPAGPGAAIVPPRQPGYRQLHHQFPCRTGPPGRTPGELRSSHAWVRQGLWARLNRRSSTSSVSTFADGPKPDLIVTIAGPAAVFARKYRQQLFPDTPLLFAAVDQRYLRDAPLGENETAVVAANDFPRVIDVILQLLPQTRQVFMVMGSGQIGKFWRGELEEQFSAISRSPDICLARRAIPSGDPAPLCQPARQLGDFLCHVRYGRGRSGVCGRAGARRPPRHGQCSSVCARTASISALVWSAGL